MRREVRTDDDERAVETLRMSSAKIFLAFLTIGGTSFGGAVPYLRDALVARRQWLDDKTFVELLSLSQSLPGLIATNMAVLLGDRLGGRRGALAGLLGMALPGAVIMFAVGLLYSAEGDQPWSSAALKGVSAAAVGLVLSTIVQLSERALGYKSDLIFAGATVLAISYFHIPVLIAFAIVGGAAIFWHRPKAGS